MCVIGRVGTIVKFDDNDNTFLVRAKDSDGDEATWWYATGALELDLGCPQPGATVKATSGKKDAPDGKSTLAFSSGDELVIKKVRRAKGQWYATEEEHKVLWFSLASTDWKPAATPASLDDDPSDSDDSSDSDNEDDDSSNGDSSSKESDSEGNSDSDDSDAEAYHPGKRVHKGGCVGKCCSCHAPCGGGCDSSTHCNGDCEWTCCGKTVSFLL